MRTKKRSRTNEDKEEPLQGAARTLRRITQDARAPGSPGCITHGAPGVDHSGYRCPWALYPAGRERLARRPALQTVLQSRLGLDHLSFDQGGEAGPPAHGCGPPMMAEAWWGMELLSIFLSHTYFLSRSAGGMWAVKALGRSEVAGLTHVSMHAVW